MSQFTHLAQSVAPYCGLLAGICALVSTSHTALFGGESFPSRASIESVLVGQERGDWLTLERGTLLMTELVVDTEVANGSGVACPSAYLVPYVAESVAGPPLEQLTAEATPGSLAVIRFEPEDFEARFPAAHGLLSEGRALDHELLDVIFDRRSCEVLRADAADLSPNIRHFLMDRWHIDDNELLVFNAGAKPMSRMVAVLLASTGLGLLLAAALALFRRRAHHQSTLTNTW